MTEEAFAQAVRTYGDTVYRVAFHALNSREDAEDMTQAVMLKLFEYGKEFESEAHLKHWLLRVSVNESRKLLRSFWRRVSVPLDDWRELAAPEHGERAELLEAVQPAYVLLTCGVDNSYGHPAQAVLDRLTEAGTAVYRTDQAGDITITR